MWIGWFIGWKESGVLWITVQLYRRTIGLQVRRELDELPARNVVHGHLALLPREDLAVATVPVNREPMATEYRTRLDDQEIDVLL